MVEHEGPVKVLVEVSGEGSGEGSGEVSVEGGVNHHSLMGRKIGELR